MEFSPLPPLCTAWNHRRVRVPASSSWPADHRSLCFPLLLLLLLLLLLRANQRKEKRKTAEAGGGDGLVVVGVGLVRAAGRREAEMEPGRRREEKRGRKEKKNRLEGKKKRGHVPCTWPHLKLEKFNFNPRSFHDFKILFTKIFNYKIIHTPLI